MFLLLKDWFNTEKTNRTIDIIDEFVRQYSKVEEEFSKGVFINYDENCKYNFLTKI